MTRTTCADVLTYLPCDILTKVDIASMAYSLECRCPFLDHEVAELAARMPIELKLSHSGGKRILIDTFHDLLPPAIQTRSKMGFGVPLDHWFRGELRPLLPKRCSTRRACPAACSNRKASAAWSKSTTNAAGTTAIACGR